MTGSKIVTYAAEIGVIVLMCANAYFSYKSGYSWGEHVVTSKYEPIENFRYKGRLKAKEDLDKNWKGVIDGAYRQGWKDGYEKMQSANE